MWFEQILYTACFYLVAVVLFRLAGKRLAGATTTFDLLVMISIMVELQQAFLLDGRENKFIFVLSAFVIHIGFSQLCARITFVRHFFRGKPARLVQDGEIIYMQLRAEGLSVEELNAGLRKAGIDHLKDVRSAYLEETGQISATRI